MALPPPSVTAAVALIPVGIALIAWWLYAAIEWHPDRASARAGALAALLLIGMVPAAAAGAGAPGGTDTPTGTPTGTPTSTPTTSTPAENSTVEELLEKDTWTDDDAQRAIEWLQTHDASTLDASTRDKLHHRLLKWDGNQGGGRQVPEEVYSALTDSEPATTTAATTPKPDSGGSKGGGSTDKTTSNTTYVGSIDDSTRIVSWTYDSGTFTVVIESDRPQLITVIQPISSNRGISRFQMGSRMIPEGRSTIRVESAEVRGMALVTLATQRAGVTISTGTEALTALGWVSSYFAWFVGSGIGLVLVIGVGWRAKRKTMNAPHEANSR